MRLAATGLMLMAGLVVAGCGTVKTVVQTQTVSHTVTQTVTVAGLPTGANTDQQIYGTVVSIEPHGDSYLLRLDPAWFLGGITANTAEAEDGGTKCEPTACPPVPNDYYVVDESHRAYVFILPADAKGTVLVSGANLFPGKTVDGAELAKIVAGTSAIKLYEPLVSGIWITIHVDTVTAFRQQYRP